MVAGGAVHSPTGRDRARVIDERLESTGVVLVWVSGAPFAASFFDWRFLVPGLAMLGLGFTLWGVARRRQRRRLLRAAGSDAAANEPMA